MQPTSALAPLINAVAVIAATAAAVACCATGHPALAALYGVLAILNACLIAIWANRRADERQHIEKRLHWGDL